MERPNEHGPDGCPIPGPDAAAGVLGGDLARDLARWASEAGADERARSRRTERALRDQAAEDATLVGVLLSLAERAEPVTLDIGDAAVTARIAGLGTDFVAAVTTQGQRILAPLRAVGAVTGPVSSRDLAGVGSVPVDVDLAGVLGVVAADRPAVLVRRRSGAPVRGVLRSAGRDVVLLWRDGDRRAPTWIPLAAVERLVLDV